MAFHIYELKRNLSNQVSWKTSIIANNFFITQVDLAYKIFCERHATLAHISSEQDSAVLNRIPTDLIAVFVDFCTIHTYIYVGLQIVLSIKTKKSSVNLRKNEQLHLFKSDNSITGFMVHWRKKCMIFEIDSMNEW